MSFMENSVHRWTVVTVTCVFVGVGCGGPIDSSSCGPDTCPPGYHCNAVDVCEADDACADVICPDVDEVCLDGICVPESEACPPGTCAPGYHCDATGRCVPDADPCTDVVCSNPGEVCRDGVCVAGESDADADGYVARDDCDDSDPLIHPGATELCNGVDDDCALITDDGAGECSGFCCGTTPACRECCSAGQCGTGGWTCDDFVCGCDGVITGDICSAGGVCTPGATDTNRDDCGWCGTMSQTRTCDATGNWGSWSGWSSCSGEGSCEPGDTRSETGSCGCSGTRSHSATCTSSCEWGSWRDWTACSDDTYCIDDVTGGDVCPGGRGEHSCVPDGFQFCTCSTSGYWISCGPCYS